MVPSAYKAAVMALGACVCECVCVRVFYSLVGECQSNGKTHTQVSIESTEADMSMVIYTSLNHLNLH